MSGNFDVVTEDVPDDVWFLNWLLEPGPFPQGFLLPIYGRKQFSKIPYINPSVQKFCNIDYTPQLFCQICGYVLLCIVLHRNFSCSDNSRFFLLYFVCPQNAIELPELAAQGSKCHINNSTRIPYLHPAALPLWQRHGKCRNFFVI